MRYYVIATDGQRYGPADIQTLQTWIGQGRIIHQTVLEEETGGARMAAGAVGALQFSSPKLAAPLTNPYSTGHPPSQSNPYSAGGSNYFRPGVQPDPGLDPNPNAYEANRCMTNAWIGFGVAATASGSFCCCPPFAIVGVIAAIVGINQALRAKSLGAIQGQTAFICNSIALVLCIGSLLLAAAMMFIN